VPVIRVADSTVDGEDERGEVTTTFTGEADPSDVASTGIGFASEAGPDAAFESVGAGRVTTTMAGRVGVSIDGAGGSVETTTGLELLAVNVGERGAAVVPSAFVVFTNEFGVRACARALSSLSETLFDARLVLAPR
jgi:hypothetical protein